MAGFRAAICAAVFILASTATGQAQDVTLISRDGAVQISGNLLGFDGEFYRVDTVYGELTVDGSGVRCEGPGCPDLESYIARVTFSGAPPLGRVLMPALLEAFSIRKRYRLRRTSLPDGQTRFDILETSGNRVLGEFTFRLRTTDEGFADLLAEEADIAMALREARPDELRRGRETGLGDLASRNGSRVVALDALVPVVAPSNPVQSVTLRELTAVLSGEIDNWQALGGPDAPIAVHVPDDRTGFGQAMEALLLKPGGAALAGDAVRHQTAEDLAAAVARDPFAIGVTGRSQSGEAWVLGLRGACGFVVRADRRSVKTEDYPLTAPLFLYLPARRFPKLVREFLSYLQDSSAQLVIRRAGFVDQAAEEIPINMQGDRFANAIAQAGEEITLEELQRMVSALRPLKRQTTTFRFEAGSAQLDAQSRGNVVQLAHAMEIGLYDARRLVFVGFSDSKGSAEANLRIARARAEKVRAAVVEEAQTADLSRISIETEAFGEAMPIACNDNAWGRQVNRRVEVWVH